MAKLTKFLVVTILFTMLGMAAGAICRAVVRSINPQYTAETVIRVLPPPDMSPFDLTIAQPASDLQYARRVSAAMLVKQQRTLEELLSRDKIRETDWFSARGGTSDVTHRAALRDLKKNFKASPMKDGDFVVLSMTGSNPKEAALIVNEMLDMFLAIQRSMAKEDVSERLVKMNNQLVLLQRDLTAAEEAVDDLRQASGFNDFEERNAPAPSAERLVRLNSLSDELDLDIAEAQCWVDILTKRIGDPNSETTQLQQANDELTVLKARGQVLTRMREATTREDKDFAVAQIRYSRLISIRNERLGRVDEVKAAIERLRAVREDPETPQLQLVAHASVPFEISAPKWQVYLTVGTLGGFLMGLVFATLSIVRGQRNTGASL